MPCLRSLVLACIDAAGHVNTSGECRDTGLIAWYMRQHLFGWVQLAMHSVCGHHPWAMHDESAGRLNRAVQPEGAPAAAQFLKPSDSAHAWTRGHSARSGDSETLPPTPQLSCHSRWRAELVEQTCD